MNELVSASAPDCDGADGQNVPPPDPKNQNRQHAQSHRRNAGQILDEQQCLAGLSQLVGLLAMGVIEPQKANSMRGVLGEILRHHQGRDQIGQKPALDDKDVLAMWRGNPEAFRMIEPFLTEDQLQMIMSEEATDGTGPT
jgi:hypothetical protein